MADRSFEVLAHQAGWRLDVYLAAALDVSRAEVRRTLERGDVVWRGAQAGLRQKGLLVSAGDPVAVRAFAPPALRVPIAEPDVPLRVVADGAGWIAVDKPAGAPVHPLAEEETGSVLGAAVARFPTMLGVGEGGLRSGIVHRLDVDTSGVLLLATEEDAWQRLRRGFRRHRVAKRYQALVHGALTGEGEETLRLAVTRHRPARVRVLAADHPEAGRGRQTRLRWRAVEALGEATLVEVMPETGFLHQIRATLAHLGHPVVGDRAYEAPETAGVTRHLLHAQHLRYQDVEAEAPVPPDFAEARRAFAGVSAEGDAS